MLQFIFARRRLFFLTIPFLVILSLLTACAGTNPQTAPTLSVPLATGSPVNLPTQGPSAANGILRVATEPIVNTDPALISSDAEVLVANAVYDYLVDITPENTIAPRLATGWQTSPDGLTYTFTLAKGITFHDGSPLTVKDVVWTFNRLRDPAAGFPTKDLYKNIASVEASGDLQVIFKLLQPNPFFLFDLSDNHALVLKAGAQDPTDFNGSGPFKVTNYIPEDRIILEANPDYFISGQPRLAKIEIIFFSDQTAEVDALRGGQVDLVMRLSTDLFSGLKTESGLTLLQVPTNQFDLVRLRADRAPGNNPLVMQALKLATDRQAIFDLVLQGFGRIGRDSPVGPMYSQYYSEESPLPSRDVEAAKALLKQAGYENGLNLELHVPDTGVRPNLAVALKDQWAAVGVNVDVKTEPESVYYADNGWLQVDLGITGWGSRPYPQFYLDTMLTCGAVWNEAHWCDQEFDAQAKIAGTTQDEQARVQAYHEIQRILIERGPVIIPYFTTQLGAIRDLFQGFSLNSFPGRSDFRQVTSGGQ